MSEGKWIPGLSMMTPAREAARLVLHRRLEAVIDALGPALQNPTNDPEVVHRLRVATRRAGAALRIFRSLLPARQYRRARNRLRQLRRAAGAARDWDVFLAQLEKQRPASTP